MQRNNHGKTLWCGHLRPTFCRSSFFSAEVQIFKFKEAIKQIMLDLSGTFSLNYVSLPRFQLFSEVLAFSLFAHPLNMSLSCASRKFSLKNEVTREQKFKNVSIYWTQS